MNVKNLMIILFFISISVPFILMNSYYPFYHYGMFAESIRHANQFESFEITYIDKSKDEHLFRSNKIGFNEGHFSYIVRSYYYQGKIQQLFSQLQHILEKNEKISRWKLKKVHHQAGRPDKVIDQIIWQKNE